VFRRPTDENLRSLYVRYFRLNTKFEHRRVAVLVFPFFFFLYPTPIFFCFATWIVGKITFIRCTDSGCQAILTSNDCICRVNCQPDAPSLACPPLTFIEAVVAKLPRRLYSMTGLEVRKMSALWSKTTGMMSHIVLYASFDHSAIHLHTSRGR